METYALDPSKQQSYEALFAFLEGCRLRAEMEGSGLLVSIAAQANALDPLAVLESIYEPQQLHFYVERRQEGLAIAGAEEAARFTPEAGAERFAACKAFMAGLLERSIAVGDSTLPFFGPQFFCAFSFFADAGQSPFAPSTVFVPRWQVAVAEGKCVAVANAFIEAGSDVAAVATRIWNANTKFRSFDYGASEVSAEARTKLELVSTNECGGPESFVRSVAEAVAEIEAGAFKKIVLARAIDLRANQAFHPLEILNTLRERYADCYAFSIANGAGQSFIGASPERLVSVKGGRINVDVLAGTAPRGGTASEDAQLGRALLGSAKDRREHGYVYESIRRRLAQLGVDTPESCQLALKKLQNVQHLHVDLEAALPEGGHLMDFVAALHPTPAVGGMPREAAVPRIRNLEPFERGLYAGALGWVGPSGEGSFLVAIRSALIDGESARVYAGVGVVEGSEPAREFEESNLKFRALLDNLL